MKIGLTLSGGGARGICHLGALEALEEAGLQPQLLSGASIGAVVGALYSAGYRPREILEQMASTPLMRLFSISTSGRGLLLMTKTEKTYRQFFKENSFESLQIPLYVTTTNLERGETVYFSQGELFSALNASCCIPMLFCPIEINGEHYIDGGLLNNLPVDPLLGKCDLIIGVHANPLRSMQQVKTLRKVMERTAYLAINTNTLRTRSLCQLFIEPPELAAYSVVQVSKIRDIYRIGYEYTREAVKKYLGG